MKSHYTEFAPVIMQIRMNLRIGAKYNEGE